MRNISIDFQLFGNNEWKLALSIVFILSLMPTLHAINQTYSGIERKAVLALFIVAILLMYLKDRGTNT